MTDIRSLVLGVASLLIATGAEAQSGAPARASATETIHGVRVEDPYRWLEDWSDPDVQNWSDARTAEARAYLDSLGAVRDMRARLTRILLGERREAFLEIRATADRVFAIRQDPGGGQPVLVVADGRDGEGPQRILVDPQAGRHDGPSRAIDWFVPSPDGRLVAVSMSEGGDERGTLHIFNVQDGSLAETPIANVYNATAGGDLAWTVDGSGFFYTRYPRPGERPGSELAFYQQVFFHRLGHSPSEDRLELGEDFGRTAEIRLETQFLTGRVLATVQDGDSGRFAVHLRQPDGSWHSISGFEDGVFQATFGEGEDIFLLTYQEAERGRILRLAASSPRLAEARQIVGELPGMALAHSFYSHVSPTMLWAGDALYLTYEAGGPTLLKIYDRNGRARAGPAIPPVSNVTGLTRGPRGAVIFAVESYTRDRRWYVRQAGAEARESALNARIWDQWSDVEVIREQAASRDGTIVPLTMLRKSGAPSRNAPVLVTAYGGFGISVHPEFTRSWRALLDCGFTIIVANIRGGGEFGRTWHSSATLANRQRAFDDFAAVIRYVQHQGYTTPRRTGIIGASNGGLLMGVAMTQHPDLIGAVVAEVGLFDMIRAERDQNGIFNIPEFGSVQDPGQFAALLAYSPYHNVVAGRDYPAAFFTTGANDPRVNPMHSRKMVARLLDVVAGRRPVLLRASREGGHGHGTPLNVQVEELADAYGFLVTQLQ